MGKSSNKLTQNNPAPENEQAQINSKANQNPKTKRRSQIIRLDEVASSIREDTEVIPVKSEPAPGPTGSLRPQTEANLNLLFKLNPAKLSYSIKETSDILALSYEFTRESIKKGIIQSVKFGDRSMVNVHELARILTEGVK